MADYILKEKYGLYILMGREERVFGASGECHPDQSPDDKMYSI